ncbi:serine hydrolase [Alteromonas sp. ASW11-130]|uniref:serine hydrolase n=1 Tax=Alteromonas sp. ASW11-130 TaxID=3015775 RepID=UPI002242B6B0|nr:serine hydrolase [Alteromonas sp. ASW11-130]MCW8092569.1 serine hydrolase [Alteromonas sp. ASW11-130]
MKNEVFAERLIYQRKLKGYSQEKLADMTNVTVRTIQRVEKGAVQPQLRTIKLLAAALEIEIDDLLQLDDPREENLQKKWLLLIHASPFIGFVLPLLNIFLPLFLWIHKKDDNIIYDNHGRAVINFQITMTLLYIVAFGALISIQGYGFYFFIAVIPFSMCVMLANVISVLRSQKYFYPLSVPFVGKKRHVDASAFAPILLLSAFTIFTSPTVDANELDESKLSSQLKEFENFLLEYQKEHFIPGISVAISKNGKMVYQKAQGVSHISGDVPVTTETPFWIASVSKFFVGTAFLSLVENGELSLDEAISDMPKFTEYCQWLAGSGIIFGKNLNCNQTFKLKHALNHVVNQKVDTAFSYNSIFYSRLSRFLEAKRGNSIDAAKGRHNELAKVITSRILEPAEMNNSIAGLWDHNRTGVYFSRARGYGIKNKRYVMRPEPERHMAGGAGVSTTAGDIVKFDLALNAGKILSDKTKALIEQPYVTAQGTSIPYAYGRYIQYVEGEKIIWHSGWDEDAGFTALYLKFPERDMTIVVLANNEGLWWGNPLDKAEIEKSPVFNAASHIFNENSL